ncbi:hypothetical protein [Brevibacillus sp. NRS-1366]|uniref:hypothetical protein n=1 Tax=Brevibacillus sp. NRS-1366 TaxID=3233899 RepID=UPI003D253BD7
MQANSTNLHRRSARAPRNLSTNKLVKANDQRMLRVNVRAPNVHFTAPVPHVSVTAPTPSVQVEAPTVQIQAPKLVIIPAPIVKVDVEAEESTDEVSLKGLRKELRKCMKENQIVELILTTDWGPDSRSYRMGTLVRVDEGLIELRTHASLPNKGGSILIPLNRIVAIIPNLQVPAQVAVPESMKETESVPLKLVESSGERNDRHLASG